MKYFALAVLGIFGLLLGSGAVHFSSAAVAPTDWNSVYASQACGTTVDLAAGNYAAQTLAGNRCAGSPIVFDGHGAVNVGTLTINASNVTFRGMTVTGTRFTVEGASNVTLDAVNAPSFDILDNTNTIDVGHGVYGNVTNRQPQISKGDFGLPDNQQPTNITIHDNTFHDFRISDTSVHSECLQVLHATNLQILRNKLYNCGGTGVLGLTCEASTNGVTVENNMLYGAANVGASYGAQISGDCRNLLFRNNSSTLDVFFADGVTGKGYSFVGNYLPYDSTLCRGSSSHNVYRGGTCNSTDLNVAALNFVSPTDLHLAAGANAIDKADPANFPAIDIDGQARVSPPDAGADEANASPLPPPTTSTAPTTTTVPSTTTTTPTTTTVPTSTVTSTVTQTVTVTSTVTTTVPGPTTTVVSTVSDCIPDAPYANCAAEITDLKSQLAAANTLAASLQAQLTQANLDKDTLQHQLDAANNTITQIKAWLAQQPVIP